jgi:hypothetical protein
VVLVKRRIVKQISRTERVTMNGNFLSLMNVMAIFRERENCRAKKELINQDLTETGQGDRETR